MTQNQPGQPSRKPTEAPQIVLAGNSRSGTTLLGRVIGRHRQVHCFHELHFFDQLYVPAQLDKPLDSDAAIALAGRLLAAHRQGYFKRDQWAAERETAEQIVSGQTATGLTPKGIYRAVLSFEAARLGKVIVCDETPQNVLYLDEILGLFPEARAVHIVRDPRSVLLSQKHKWRRRALGGSSIPLREAVRSWINYHPITIGRIWSASVSGARKAKQQDRILHLRYEDLTEMPEATVAKICNFLDLDYQTTMLDVAQVGSSHRTDHGSRSEPATGIVASSAGKWRNGALSQAELFLLQATTRNEMRAFGYDPAKLSPNYVEIGLRMLYFPLHIGLALLVNVRRMTGLFETVRRRF